MRKEILRPIKPSELVARAKLDEMDLAEDPKINRSPVREAFRALEEATPPPKGIREHVMNGFHRAMAAHT